MITLTLAGALPVLLTPVCLASPLLSFEHTLAHPPGGTQRVRPTCVTIDPARSEVCITNQASANLLLYNHADVLVFQTGGLSDVVRPQDACIDARGGMVFTDDLPEGGRTIRRLNFLGEPLHFKPVRPVPQWSPGHLQLLRSGDLVTIDDRTGLMVKHDGSSGALIWSRDLGEELEQLPELVGRPAEASDGRLYVPAGQARRVLVYSADGVFVTSFGRPGTGVGEFAFPVGVAFDREGRILVLDRMRHTVILFDADHELIGELVGFGSGEGYLYHPLSISIAPDGRVYIAQGYRGRVQVFRFHDPDLAAGQG